MLPSEIPKLPTDLLVRGFPGVWKLLLLHDSLPGWVFIPNSFVSHFIFCILSYLLLKTMGWFSGCLVSSASIQKLFCGICSAFKCSFNEFVGEKVVSPSYSSAILGLPLETWDPNSTTRVWTHTPYTGSTVLFFVIWTFIFFLGTAG